MIHTLYRLLTTAASPLILAMLARRRARGKEDRARQGERLGIARRRRPDGPLVWLHGASVGESISALPLINRILEVRPDLNILVTTGTVTSARLMEERLPASPFYAAEWRALGSGKDWSKYIPLSLVEKTLPTVFIIAYFCLAYITLTTEPLALTN